MTPHLSERHMLRFKSPTVVSVLATSPFLLLGGSRRLLYVIGCEIASHYRPICVRSAVKDDKIGDRVGISAQCKSCLDRIVPTTLMNKSSTAKMVSLPLTIQGFPTETKVTVGSLNDGAALGLFTFW